MKATILVGDVLDRLRDLPDVSVQCVVTSPPYWGLRDYQTGSWDGGDPGCDHKQTVARHDGGRVQVNGFHGSAASDSDKGAMNYRGICGKCGALRIDKQLGLENTPEEYVAKMVAIFRDVRRVLRDDGTLWLNLGDSYCSTAPGTMGDKLNQRGILAGVTDICAESRRKMRPETPPGLKPKDLVGIPWMTAFALRADGWYLRQEIIWSKPNPMPESVTDRCTKAHESLFLFAKNGTYYYDKDAIAEEAANAGKTVSLGEKSFSKGQANGAGIEPSWNGTKDEYEVAATRNKRTVWEITTQPFPEAHFATYPEKLVEPCVLAGTSERGCCVVCGTPWKRIVKETRTFESGSGKAENKPNGKYAGTAQAESGDYDIRMGPVVTTETVGWESSCKCDSDTTACVVLDPFCGSGTTGVVALRHNRDFIGIELNADYATIAETRIKNSIPWFCADSIIVDGRPLKEELTPEPFQLEA